MGSITLSLEDACDLVCDALVANRTEEGNAKATARSLVNAEADNQTGHGLSRVRSYAAQSLSGKVDGFAQPVVERVAASSIRIDGKFGFAYPAINLALAALPELARKSGIAVACIGNSHHFGQAGAHVEQLAERGLVGILLGNSPKAIAFWGSEQAAMGTNPIAFAAPLGEREPLVIDLSLSVVARGRIVAAKSKNERIPEGWALDCTGKPTTDPGAALQGSMLPIGGAKGAALALMVEILAAALTGSNFGFEASTVFDGEGKAPCLGQTLIAFSPEALSGGQFSQRMDVLVRAIESASGSRLPGESRLKHRLKNRRDGLQVSRPLYREILEITRNRVAIES